MADIGYISLLEPLEFSDNIIEAYLLSKDECSMLNCECIEEERLFEVPMLDDKMMKLVAKELIYLDANIVSKKTYYDVFGCEPSKKEIKEKIKSIKNEGVFQ